MSDHDTAPDQATDDVDPARPDDASPATPATPPATPTTPATPEAELYGDPRALEGLEAYPYASIEAERTIKRAAGVLSFVTLGFLLAGLYLALFSTRVGLGGLLTLVGFIGLMIVPVVAKRLRRAALARESQTSTG